VPPQKDIGRRAGFRRGEFVGRSFTNGWKDLVVPRGRGEYHHFKSLKQNASVKTWSVLPTLCRNYWGARYFQHRGGTTDHT
jgi:hypothetical protein